MPYDTQEQLTDVNGNLINQHFDEEIDNYSPARGEDGALHITLPLDRDQLEAAAKGGVAPGGTDLLAFDIDPGPHTTNAYAVRLLEPTQFVTFTAADCTVPTSRTWPAGTVISSAAGITEVELASGAIELFKNATA